MRCAIATVALLALAATYALADGMPAPSTRHTSRPAASPAVTPTAPATQAPPAAPAAAPAPPPEPTYEGDPYETLREPYFTDDFIEPWVPSDVARDHWSYEWMSWMAEEGLLREVFPVEELGHPFPPEHYGDEAAMATSPELLDSVVRLTHEGIVIGRRGGVFAADSPATRCELGLVACRTALHLKEMHPRLVLVHPPGPPAKPVELSVAATRYEMAEALVRVMRCLAPLDVMIHDVLEAPPATWALPADVPTNHRYAPAVAVVTTLAIMETPQGGAFAGNAPAMRGDVAQCFTRMLDVLESRP
jgi:hypothetical protein